MTFPPLPGANLEGWGYLQTNQEGIPHTGVDYNIFYRRGDDDLGKEVVTPWDAMVVSALPKLQYSWGRLVVLRCVLPEDVISAGHKVPAGTVVYPRFGHLASFSAYRGQRLKAGTAIGTCGGSNGLAPGTFKSATDKNGEYSPHLHFDLRNGGPSGLSAWDAGDEWAVQEWPSCAGYGYPEVGAGSMIRTVALRFIDPLAAIPLSKLPNAYRPPAVLR